MPDVTVADQIIQHLAARGVRHIYGVPGGDCNLDIIEAGDKAGIPFVLSRTETSGAIMACVEGELTGAPGVVMTTRGPGLANAANGVAYASLDRAALVVIADQYEDKLDFVTHQRVDQAALLRPLTRAEIRLNGGDTSAELTSLLDAATAEPPGPVYLEITGPSVRAPAPTATPPQRTAPAPAGTPAGLPEAAALLQKSRRPIIIAGLQARSTEAGAALQDLATRRNCPVLVSYKAKGVISDLDPHVLGCYIAGAAEAATIRAADLVILYGFDPIENPPGAWKYDQPIIELTTHAHPLPTIVPAVSLTGDLATSLNHLDQAFATTEWTAAELAAARAEIRACALAGTGGPIAPQDIVLAALEIAPPETRVTVDAGAHMLSVLHLWPSRARNDLLLSRGLATMGFALPAAIGACLAEPTRPVIAFTGDGGLMMCTAELGTAVQNNCKLVVIVFNDSCLTLIHAKQARRQMARAGVTFSPTDFSAIARGFGCAAFRVEQPDELRPAIAAALAADGPAVIDVVVNPQAYDAQIIALRG